MFQRFLRSITVLALAGARTVSATAATLSTAEVTDNTNNRTDDRTKNRTDPPRLSRGIRIAAAGDIACEPPYRPRRTRCRHAATARLIGDGVRAVLPLGDTQYERGTRSDYRRSYDPTWGRFRNRTYPVVGNHEYLTPGAAGYFGYFGKRAHGPRGYYAYDLGRWRMYTLNTMCRQVNCNAQLRWLRKDLSTHPRRCSLVAMHHPRFSSGEEGNKRRRAGIFWPALDRHQVDVALSGHDHVYERFARMTNAGNFSRQGIRSFVVGTGGKDLRGFPDVQPGSRVRSNASAGVLFMSLRSAGYGWRFRTVDGKVRDAGRGRCVR